MPFQLVADTEKTLSEQFGTWGEKSMYGRSYMGMFRTTFIIDEKDINQPIKNADIALYEAKNKGRSTLFNFKDLRIEDTVDFF